MEKQKKPLSKTDKLRRKAEVLLKNKKEVSKASFSEPDILKLIHELEVHQIELELQNKELKLAKEKAELTKRKYIELYDFAPSGYLTLTKTGEIIDLNMSTERLLGKRRSQLVRNSFGFFVSPDTRAVYNRFMQKIFKSRLKETCELKLETGDGSIKLRTR